MLEWTINGASMILGILILIGLICIVHYAKKITQSLKISENQNADLGKIVNDLKGIAIEIHATLNDNDKKATKLSSDLKNNSDKNIVALEVLDTNLSKWMTSLGNNLNQIMSIQNISNDKKATKLSADIKDISDKNIMAIGTLDSNLSKLMTSIEKYLSQTIKIQTTINDKFDKILKISENQNLNLEKTVNDLKAIAIEIHTTLNEVVKIDLS
jgi:hypothetical protein